MPRILDQLLATIAAQSPAAAKEGLLGILDTGAQWGRGVQQRAGSLAELANPMAVAEAVRTLPQPGLLASLNQTPNNQDALKERAMELGMNMGPSGLGGLLGATVWHGSPYKFDKFDMSKIGTGEGAQAYGHGLYLAENPGVAKGYREKLAKNEVLFDGQKVTHNPADLSPQSMGLNALQIKPSPESAAKALRNAVADESLWQRGSQYDHRERYSAAADWLDQNAKRLKVDSGSLYKVDLPDDQIAKMLDWDAPLSKQPESVRKVLIENKLINANDSRTVEDLYYDLVSSAQDSISKGKTAYASGELRQMERLAKEMVANTLNKLGISGIKYLDQGSRGAGQGTRNFVIFDSEIIKILGRE